MFFLLMIVTLHGHQTPLTGMSLADTYANREACMSEGYRKATVMMPTGVHGRYMCMYRHESDAALAHETKVVF